MKQLHPAQLPAETNELLQLLVSKIDNLQTELKELKDLMAISEASFNLLQNKVETLEGQLIEVNESVFELEKKFTKDFNDFHDSTTETMTALLGRITAMEKTHLELAKNDLTIGLTSEIIENLQLPLIYKDEYGCTIEWKSDRPQYISDTGKITKPTHEEGDQSIVLTATLTYGGSTDTKKFTYVIPALPAPEPEQPTEPPVTEPETETPQS